MVFEREQVLKDVISEVLETMFFAMVEFEDAEAGNHCFDYQSEINLSNHDERIVISLRVSEEFAAMISANFLGIEEVRISCEDMKDSLKELVNMVGGGYHAQMNDSGWQLGIPTASEIGSKITHATPEAVGINFAFFGEPAGSAFLRYSPA